MSGSRSREELPESSCQHYLEAKDLFTGKIQDPQAGQIATQAGRAAPRKEATCSIVSFRLDHP